jgi:hypothetical protein
MAGSISATSRKLMGVMWRWPFCLALNITVCAAVAFGFIHPPAALLQAAMVLYFALAAVAAMVAVSEWRVLRRAQWT